jgi:hypothetical protein
VVNGGIVGEGRVEGVGRAEVVKGASDRAGIGAREIGGVRMDSQDHVGSPIDLATIRMGRDKAEKAVKAREGCKGGGGLFGGEGAGRREDASVDAAPVVQEVADCYLQLLDLGGGGWGRNVRPSGGLGGPGSVGGWGIEGGGGCR